ncbi:hypothetical protein DCS_04020 [Drechmeria coniospora]|uniref:Uncharacterized protein n=1 Tax=Drechmeria coniospora TaxID=98403 RepID=A0A151GIR4_DRECN|nr:hypothetical protein DCS_04020 [Drechmeria coniospora]KYK57013.1 hypothetical protein DCS_04020 [Drechmeria coniospora]
MLRQWITLLSFLLWLQWPSFIYAIPTEAVLPAINQIEEKIFTLALFSRPEYVPYGTDDLNTFHWAIHASKKGSRGEVVDSFDASDWRYIRQGNKQSVISNHPPSKGHPSPFMYQYKYAVEPANVQTFMARINIGSATTSTIEVTELFRGLKLPGPGESCLNWAQSAMLEMQLKGMAKQFDVGTFSQKALEYALGRV